MTQYSFLICALTLLGSTTIFASESNNINNSNDSHKQAKHSEKASQANCVPSYTGPDRLSTFRDGTHKMFCRTVRSIDSWFGNEQEFDDSNFGGKLIVGFRQDEDEGFDPRVRLRLNAKLPNVSRRFDTFIGRTDNDAFIQDRKVTGIDEINNDLANENVRWLIGLGYRNPKKTGFDTSLGASFSSGLQPFVKLRYRYFKQFNGFSGRFKQTLFWENDEGFGTTSNLSFNKPINDNYLATLDIESTILRDTEIFENAAGLNLFKKLSSRSGIALRAFIQHESGNNSVVTIPEYGVSINYRRPIFKPWLILRTSLENRWERDNDNEPIESFVKVGIQLEMTFGNFKRKR